MHKHDHECEGCKHECLHYCSCCDRVYCCKCGREWTTTTPITTYTCEDNTSTVTVNCLHSH